MKERRKERRIIILHYNNIGLLTPTVDLRGMDFRKQPKIGINLIP